MICLEGQQAGLSWITVLKKRENYRKAFHQFDPAAVAAMTDDDVQKLVLDTGIIRHRGKIQAIIGNARAYLAMEQNGEPFSAFVWSFVDNEPKVTQAATLAEIPTSTPASDALSKALKNAALSLWAPPSVTPLCRPAGWSMTTLRAASAIRRATMIRKWQSENTAPLLSLWLESTTEAHPFIDASYWQANEAVVWMNTFPPPRPGLGRKRYPVRFYQRHAVPVRGGAVCRPGVHRKGDWACAAEPRSAALPVFNPEVYQKNVRAVNFYHAQGFRIEDKAPGRMIPNTRRGS